MRLPSIVHLDADAFFVSVEQARDPSLRGRKVAVGGRERGIIASASYEARACGVYTPMPTQRALKVCPDLILVRHGHGIYSEYSRRLFDLCETLTPLVERRSIDEGFLDATPCAYRDSCELEAAVRALQRRIWDELGITVSFGLATNKLVAGIASKLRKPRGFVVVPPGEEAAFLAPLPVGKLPGIGDKTEAYLRENDLHLVGDLLACPEAKLQCLVGDGWRSLRARALGEDDAPVESEDCDAKSYSQQETFFTDIGDIAEVVRIVKRMLDELLGKVRADGKCARTLTLKVRYPDFTQASAGRSLATASDLEAPFYPLVEPLLEQAWRQRRRPLRLVSAKFSGIEDRPAQLEMFSEGDERRRRLAATLDALNARNPAGQVMHGHQLAKRKPPP